MREQGVRCSCSGTGVPSADAGKAPLAEWNDTSQAFPENVRIAELVAAQTNATPDAVAVVANGEALTYRELDLRASRLAHHLLSRGAGPERLVVLCLERSLASVVGALGILKTLDPTWPLGRLLFMLNDSGAALDIRPREGVERLNERTWAFRGKDIADAWLKYGSL